MAKSGERERKRKRRSEPAEIELVEDAWPRFEKFIKEIVKAGPQHRKPSKRKPAKSEKP
jgi:hypothetical protein